MRTITIRNMPRELEQRVEDIAREEGTSLAQTVIRLLLRATGLRASESRGSGAERHHELDELAGTWTDEDAEAFARALREQRSIDPDIWE